MKNFTAVTKKTIIPVESLPKRKGRPPKNPKPPVPGFKEDLIITDPSGLVEMLKANPGIFDAIPLRTKFNPMMDGLHDIWVHMPRITGSLETPADVLKTYQEQYAESTENVWYRGAELPLVRAVIYALAYDNYASEIGRVVISKLPPGCEIKAHSDSGAGNEKYVRFHWALQSAPGQVFWCGEGEDYEEYEAPTGSYFYFRNDKLHGVKNASKKDRYTLHVDLKVPFVAAYKHK